MVAVLAACLAVAIGVPLTWWLTRPEPNAGVAVTALPSNGQTGSEPSTTPTTGEQSPAVRTRKAVPRTGRDVPAPAALRIPAIDVEAGVDAVGVLRDGSMVIPKLARRVGWYRYGPAPGAKRGSAVIAGHVDARTQGTGALYRLREIDVGATITVQTRSGGVLRYRVVGKQTIVKQRLPTERLFARDGPPRLVLITCGGPFNAELRSYRDNLVVLAEPVS